MAHGILVSDPVPIGLWILTAFGLAFGLGLGILDLGPGLDNCTYLFLVEQSQDLSANSRSDIKVFIIFMANFLNVSPRSNVLWMRDSGLICPGAQQQQTSSVTTSPATGETVTRIRAPSSHHNCGRMSEVYQM